MSLVINNKVVKSKKGFTTLIKREGISSVNDMSLLKAFLNVDCKDENLIFGIEMYLKYNKVFSTMIKDLVEIGEHFEATRYEEYCAHRFSNPNINGERELKLKYGEENYKLFYNKIFKEKPNRWQLDYHLSKGLSKEEAEDFINFNKEYIPGSLKFFTKKYGDLGQSKYEEFGNKSKHTEESFKEKYEEDWEQKWAKYIDKKRETSVFSKELWVKNYPKDWEEKYRDFIKNNCNTSSIFFWENRGFSTEESFKIVSEIHNKKGVKFRNASKQSLKKLKDIISMCDELEVPYLIGTDGDKEKSILSEDGKIRYYDFCIESIKTIIEYNHEKYHPKENNEEYMEKWLLVNKDYLDKKDFLYLYENDKFKYDLAVKHGYKIHYIWNFSSKDEILKIKKLINEDIKNTEK